MDLLLDAVWTAAEALGVVPNVVLAWRESELAMWTVVADRRYRQRMLTEMVALSHAVWDPKGLPRLLGERQPRMTKEEATAALERAERVGRIRMREARLDEVRGRK